MVFILDRTLMEDEVICLSNRSKEREEQAQRFGALIKRTLKVRRMDQTERLFEHQI